jgi:hypothetical protein
MKPTVTLPGADLYLGDCLSVLPHIPPASVDAVVCDPPYPCIERSYGRLTEAEWHGLMHALVPEVRRVLKPSGSAVFVLQPNSERVGRMRTWLWEFMAWVGREWNVVQDAYWWNYTAIPGVLATRHGLMRGSVKACVWCGPADCYRDQGAVLWRVSDYTVRQSMQSADRWKETTASGHAMNRTAASEAAIARGGSTPYNLLPVANSRGHTSAGANGHGAGTPLALCSWWMRYISPVGGVILDPFQGSGTVGLAALSLGRHYVGIEREPDYHAIAVRRLTEAAGPLFANAPGTVGIDSPPPESQPTLFPL